MPLPRDPLALLARTPGSRWGEVPGLSEKRRKALANINRRKAKIVRDAQKITQHALSAPEVDPNSPDMPEGWTPEQFRVAQHALLPKRDAPVYLEIAKAITAAHEKADTNQQQAPSLNIGTVNIVQAPVYEAIDISEADKK